MNQSTEELELKSGIEISDEQLFSQLFFGIQDLPLRSPNCRFLQAADLIAMNHFDMSEDPFFCVSPSVVFVG